MRLGTDFLDRNKERPWLIAYGFILAVCYIPTYIGFNIQPGWVVLACSLWVFFLKPVEMGTAHWLGLSFLVYAFVSLLWTPIFVQGVWDLAILSIFAACFVLGTTDRKLDGVFIGITCGLGVSDFIAILQFGGWTRIPILTTPAGLFVNPDMLSEVGLLVSLALIAVRVWWPLAFSVPAIFIGGARSVLVTILVVGSIAVWERFRLKGVAILISGVVAVGGLLLAVNGAKSFLRLESTFGHHSRLSIWLDTIDGITPFGHGAGSYISLFPAYATRYDTMGDRPENPHNEYLEFAFKFGIGAIPVAAIAALALFGSGPYWYMALAFLSISFVSFPIYLPLGAFLGGIALGRTCGTRNLVWGFSRSGRPALRRRSVYGAVSG